jgi:hypothetical protein
LLEEVQIPPRLMFWNPGQGHLPVALSTRARGSLSEIALAGRDSLELTITERNLRASGFAPRTVIPLAAESFLVEAFAGSLFDLICGLPHPAPRVPWQEDMADAARSLLAPSGTLLLAAKSTEIHRFLERASGLRLMADRKHFGFRAVLLRRSGE